MSTTFLFEQTIRNFVLLESVLQFQIEWEHFTSFCAIAIVSLEAQR